MYTPWYVGMDGRNVIDIGIILNNPTYPVVDFGTVYRGWGIMMANLDNPRCVSKR